MNDKNIPLGDAELDSVSGGMASGPAIRSAMTGLAGSVFKSGYAANIASAAHSIVSGTTKCPCGGTFVLKASAGKYVCDRCGDVLSAGAER